MKPLVYALSLALMLTPITAICATYNGRDVDGLLFMCDVQAPKNTYTLQCEFDLDNVIVHFNNGGYIVLDMYESDFDSKNILFLAERFSTGESFLIHIYWQ